MADTDDILSEYDPDQFITTRDAIAHTPQPSFLENEGDRISRAWHGVGDMLRQSEGPLLEGQGQADTRLSDLVGSIYEKMTGHPPDPETSGVIPTLTGALVGRHPAMPKRVLAALDRAKEITADQSLNLSPGQRTEKAWEAGRTAGGWDRLPVRMGENGEPEREWVRYMPTFEQGKPVIAEGTFPSEAAYFRRNWRGKEPIDRAEGKAGELININPDLLKLYPDLADIPMKLERGDSRAVRSGKVGGYAAPGWLFGERLKVSGYNDKDIEEILSHELQHALQQRQGWEGGSNPNLEKRPWINKEEAFNRYRSNIGEQNAELNSLLDVNEPYGHYTGYMPTFPTYETNPAFDPKARRGSAARSTMIQRDASGSTPREMPPSWQYKTKVENMREFPGMTFPMLWNAAKWGAIGNAPYWLTKWYNDKQKADQEDEGKAFAPREMIHPTKRSELGDLYGEDAKAAEDSASSNRMWGYGMLGGNVAGATSAMVKPRHPWMLIPTALGAMGALSYINDAHRDDARAKELRGAQKAWGNTGLPDRSEREGHQAGGTPRSDTDARSFRQVLDQIGEMYKNLPEPRNVSPLAEQEANAYGTPEYDPLDVLRARNRMLPGNAAQWEYEGPQDEAIQERLGEIGRNFDLQNRSPQARGGLVRMILAEYHTPANNSFLEDLGHGHPQTRDSDSSDRS